MKKARRSNREDSISITSRQMLICTEACRGIFIDYVIAPNETDYQVGRCHNQSESSSLVSCRDSNELACGNKNAVLIDSCFK